MKQETLLKLLFIDVILAFDIFAVWFSFNVNSVLPIVFAFTGAVFHWPSFMANIQLTNLSRTQKLWLIFSIDAAVAGAVYALLSQSYYLILFYAGASLLTLVLRRSSFVEMISTKEAIPA